MGLTSITIENFKGIGAPVTVPLCPITLLFGANSAGKSTIIQALQYAWEVLENRNPDVDRTRLGGEVIDLGGFRNLVHQHDLERSIKITLEYQGKLQNGAYLLPESFWSDTEQRLRYGDGVPNITEWVDIKSLSVKISTGWDPSAMAAFISSYEVGLNGKPFSRIQALSRKQSCLTLNRDHPFFDTSTLENCNEYASAILLKLCIGFGDHDEWIAGNIRGLCPSERMAYLNSINDMQKMEQSDETEKESHSFTSLLAALDIEGNENRIFVNNTIPEWGSRLPYYQTLPYNSDRPFNYALEEEVSSVMDQITVGAGDSILNELRGLRYLGPLRKVPNRLHAVPLRPESSRWANGLGAWDALLRSTPVEEDGPSLVERCSDYLHDTLGLQYTLRREDRIHLPANSELFARLQLMATRFEETEGDELRRLVSEIEALNRTPVVQLHDEKNDVDVDPMDIGVGVSQTLPVVVGAVEPSCTIFAVEQPELHIHPAVQVNLADIFLREILEEGKKPRLFLLETHSEHLVLRIMRRMRETDEGTLPEGFPQVKPEDVAILYVEFFDDRTIIREMPLNERGELIKAWPGGFFEEDFEELF